MALPKISQVASILIFEWMTHIFQVCGVISRLLFCVCVCVKVLWLLPAVRESGDKHELSFVFQ